MDLYKGDVMKPKNKRAAERRDEVTRHKVAAAARAENIEQKERAAHPASPARTTREEKQHRRKGHR